MPLYEYECVSCGARLERRQRFDEAPLTECPECRDRLRRVLYPAGIIFRGSGWYCTDSRPRSAEEGKDTRDVRENKGNSEHKQAEKAKDTTAA